jgi:hypothetical protein
MEATLAPSLFSPTSLQHFVDDELLRAPLIAEQVIDGALEHARKAMSQMQQAQRTSTQVLVQSLLGRRRQVAAAFTAALQETANHAISAVRAEQSHAKAPLKLADARPENLCLIDEDAVAVDVELSHVVSAIRDGAEHELRELRCYLAAMAGDQAVSTDHNPFKPEGYAQALWAAALELPLERTHHTAFLRHAGQALAAVLRKSYAAACTRLEGMGVQPASYRTIVFGSGAPALGGLTLAPPPNLQRMREAMPGVRPVVAVAVPVTPAGPRGPSSALLAQALAQVYEAALSARPAVRTAGPNNAAPRSPAPGHAPVQHRLGLFKGQITAAGGAIQGHGHGPQKLQNKGLSHARIHAPSYVQSQGYGPNPNTSTPSAPPHAAIPRGQAAGASGLGRPKDREVGLPHWSEFTAASSDLGERQAVELVGRLFEAMLGNTALPADVVALIARLHGPAMRLVVGDSALLDQDSHPLWRFIHRLVYEAQMRPLPDDPERLVWLQACQRLIEGLANDPKQDLATYEMALARLERVRQQRLEVRCTAAAAQIAELGRLEARLCAGAAPSSTQGGMVDLGLLDTVPAHILARMQDQVPPANEAQDWLQRLEPGVWVRLFIDARWVHAQVLWLGERGELWLIADGATRDTWAVRRNAFLRMRASALAKTLQIRSLVASAAVQVQESLNAAAAPA